MTSALSDSHSWVLAEKRWGKCAKHSERSNLHHKQHDYRKEILSKGLKKHFINIKILKTDCNLVFEGRKECYKAARVSFDYVCLLLTALIYGHKLEDNVYQYL
jgi:hypothetical protein